MTAILVQGLFWLSLFGLAVAIVIPLGCVFLVACHVNAGTQLGVGIAGVIGGALFVIAWKRP